MVWLPKVSASSKMYEETIYPFFQSRLREVSALGLGANPNVKETFGTLPNRVGGLTSDEYRSGSKSQVKKPLDKVKQYQDHIQ